MNENPVIESIMYKQDVAKEFVFDSAGPNDSLNDLVNQTIAEADEGTIISWRLDFIVVILDQYIKNYFVFK